MADSDWRDRLRAAIDKSGYSAREISLKAGKGPGYVHSILKEGKDPTVDSIMAVCAALNVSLSHILLNVEMSREAEEILREIETKPHIRTGVLQILGRPEP